MVFSSKSQPKPSVDLIKFLIQKIGLSENAINLGIRQSNIEQAPLGIILWSFGLLTIDQYQRVLDWQNNYE